MPHAIKTQINQAVFEMILDRPDIRNAMDLVFFDELIAACQEAQNSSCRAVLIRAEGPAFSVGGNLKFFSEFANSGQIIPKSGPDRLHAAIKQIRALTVPVVALVHGGCAGAGLSLALACDLVIAADGAKFNLAYAGVGLSPDGGASYFLPRHVGLKQAMEIFLTGRTFDADEAKAMGLVNRIVSSDNYLEEGRQFVELLSQGPTAAFAKVKQLLARTFDHSLDQQLELEAELFSDSTGTADFKTGVNGFLQKTMPEFKGC